MSTSNNNAQTVEIVSKTSLEIILHKPHTKDFQIVPHLNIIIHKRKLNLSTNSKFKNRNDKVFLFFIDVFFKITINHFAISRSKMCKLNLYQDCTITFFIDNSVN